MTQTSMRLAVAVVTGIDEYQSRLLRGMAPVLEEKGVSLVVHANDLIFRGVPNSLKRLLREPATCGVITSATQAANEEEDLSRLLGLLRLPTVRIGMTSPDAASVHGDNITGMRALMKHLIDDRQARRIALVRGVRHQPDSIAREGVFREELRRRGVPVEEDLVIDGEFFREIAYRSMRELLERRRDFDAVVALNDQSAFGVLSALADEGIRVPEDVAVTGFDNEAGAALNWPGLTTVDQDLETQGAMAARLLIAQMEDDPAEEDVTIPSRLIVRASTAPKDRPYDAELENAITMAKAARVRLASQDVVVGMNRAMVRCRTMDDVIQALIERLERLGVGRCFLSLYERVLDDDGTEVTDTDNAHLLLDYRDGRAHPVDGTVYATSSMLPRQLMDEARRGLMVLQPLSVLDRDLGYVLFDPGAGPVRVTELLRMDLSRTLDAVATTQELERHAATLERLVARRTRELENEVLTRRRAERELKRANAELQRSLMLDGLTRIANRAAFARHLEQHWEVLAREGGELALLMVDVDMFKAYNDRYGHVLGDEALRTVASCLEQSVRDPEDLACRYGGEEFSVVLPRSGIQGAVAVAVRFRTLLAEAAIPHAASTVAPVVTASIGIAVVQPTLGTAHGAVVEAADQALYRAKELGRDRVAVAGRGQRQGVTRTGAPMVPQG